LHTFNTISNILSTFDAILNFLYILDMNVLDTFSSSNAILNILHTLNTFNTILNIIDIIDILHTF